MIRVAVADDSPFTCRLLASYLECAGNVEIIGTAHDAASTMDLLQRTSPDVVTLDLEMPGADGLGLLQRIVRETTTAVVVVSGVSRRAAATTLRALEIGAVDVVLKYTPGAPISPTSLRREIVSKVTTAAAVQPRRGARAPVPETCTPARRLLMTRRHEAMRSEKRPPGGVVVLGASTGGPPALRQLLAQLPSDFNTPCVVVQHLPAPFIAAFADELARHATLPVREAQPGAQLQPRCIVVAPGSRHLLVRPGGRLELRPATEEELHRPSIDFAMVSAAESYAMSSIGVVLSGMGCDGAEGLKRIRLHGGHGYVQDPSTCVVDSMPAHALERAGADFVGRPDVIGTMLALRGS
ncbi:MAG TPA: chemotaxis protein CheB [Vicinamibacterales bacterium]|nr:chemotaxis protein CheB [Vicinamibacterales bacterium]